MNKLINICASMLIICCIGGFASVQPSFAADVKDVPKISDNKDQEIKDEKEIQAPKEEPKVDDKSDKSDKKAEEPKPDDKDKTPNDSSKPAVDKEKDKSDASIVEITEESNSEAKLVDEKSTEDKTELKVEDSTSDTTKTISPDAIDPEQIYQNKYLKLRTNTYTMYFPKDLREGIISMKERDKYGLDFALENVYTINNIWGQNIYRYPADIKSAPEDFSDYWQAMLDTLLETSGTEQEGEASIYGSKDYQWRHAEFLLTLTPKGELVPLKTIKIEDKSFKMPEENKDNKTLNKKVEIKVNDNSEIKAEDNSTKKPDTKTTEKTDEDKPKTKKVPVSDQPIIKVRLSIYSTDAEGIFYTIILFRYDDLASDDTDKTVKEIIGSFNSISKNY